MANKEELTYEGYIFANSDDVLLAQNEIKKIEYIKSKVNFNDVTMLKGVYAKALENKSFVTPIGLSFMHELQEYIKKKDTSGEEMAPIPLYNTFRRITLSSSDRPVRERVTRAQKEELDLKTQLRNSRIICGILVVLITAMFIITMTGSNPNIINYKTAITNQYSAWEQELTEREAIVREKERELNLAK